MSILAWVVKILGLKGAEPVKPEPAKKDVYVYDIYFNNEQIVKKAKIAEQVHKAEKKLKW